MRRGSIRAAHRARPSPSAWLTPSRRPLVGSIASGVYGQGVLVITGVIVARSLGPTDRGYLAFILLLEAIVFAVGREPWACRRRRHTSSPATARERIASSGPYRRNARADPGSAPHPRAERLVRSSFVHGDPERVWQAALLTLPLIPALLGQDYALFAFCRGKDASWPRRTSSAPSP